MVFYPGGGGGGLLHRRQVADDGPNSFEQGRRGVRPGGLDVSQSSTIAFYLGIGFVIFITLRGELPKYAAVIGIGKTTAGAN